jgi:hypothetical protein
VAAPDVDAEAVPALQPTQLELAELDWYMPAAQLEHCDDPAAAYVPGAQLVQPPVPPCEFW